MQIDFFGATSRPYASTQPLDVEAPCKDPNRNTKSHVGILDIDVQVVDDEVLTYNKVGQQQGPARGRKNKKLLIDKAE
ncbi:hypothetical protein V6N13_091853 [Hibiscus sabdariffa]